LLADFRTIAVENRPQAPEFVDFSHAGILPSIEAPCARNSVTALGHEDQFRPPSLNGGCRLGKATFAGMGGKEEDAPKAVLAEANKSRLARKNASATTSVIGLNVAMYRAIFGATFPASECSRQN
jgi:hypothetical protein